MTQINSTNSIEKSSEAKSFSIASFLASSWYDQKKRTFLFLFLLTTLGFILRLIAALNMDVLADDMLYASQSAGIIDSKILSTHSNPALFFYLTDIAYTIFGYTTFASRFWPLIFGTLLIPLSFLLARKFFNASVALSISFFVTLSNFLIKMTFTEQTLVVLFFVMFAVYLGMIYVKNENDLFIFSSASLFGLAFLTKYSAPFFLFSFLIFIPYYAAANKEKILKTSGFSRIFLFFFIILLFSLPFLSFNYFIHKESGILDVYFSRVFPSDKTQQIYGGLAGQENSFFDNLQNIGSYNNIFLPWFTDPIITIFALIGILFWVQKREKLPLAFLLIFLIPPFILQSAGSTLPKHFAFMVFLLAFPAGYSLHKISYLIKKRGLIYLAILILLIATIFAFTYGTPSNLLTPSANSQLKSFLYNDATQKDLIVFDSRIYTAQSFWIATNHHFLDAIQFQSIYSEAENSTKRIPIRAYFVECLIDDCGWGTIKNQQALNQSLDNFFNSLSSQNLENHVFSQRLSPFAEKQDIYRVFITTIYFPDIIEQTDTLHNFYFTPYLYKNRQSYLFGYTLRNSIDILISKTAYFMLLLAMFFSILSIPSLAYFIKKELQKDD